MEKKIEININKAYDNYLRITQVYWAGLSACSRKKENY